MSDEPRCPCPNPPTDCYVGCPVHGIKAVSRCPYGMSGPNAAEHCQRQRVDAEEWGVVNPPPRCLVHSLRQPEIEPQALPGVVVSPTIVYSDRKRCPKLTITRERLELKLTEAVRAQEADYVRLAQLVAAEIGTPMLSLRGKFYAAVPGKLRISMYYDSRRILWGTREIGVALATEDPGTVIIARLQRAVSKCTDPQARATAEYMLRVAQGRQEP